MSNVDWKDRPDSVGSWVYVFTTRDARLAHVWYVDAMAFKNPENFLPSAPGLWVKIPEGEQL